MTVQAPNNAVFAVLQDRRMSTELQFLLQSYADEINRLAEVIAALEARVTALEP